MKDICATCLATDRRLKTLNKSRVFGTLKYLMMQTGYNNLRPTNKVCRECIALLNNVKKFQNKALNSLRTLEKYSRKSEIHKKCTNNSQTTLGNKTLDNINIHEDLIDSNEVYNEYNMVEVGHDDANTTRAHVKLEEYEDATFIESQPGIDVNADPLINVSFESVILNECKDGIIDINNDNEVVKFEDNLQIHDESNSQTSLGDTDEKSYKDIIELDHNYANTTKAHVKVKEYGDVMYIENDIEIPVNADPLSNVESESTMLDDKFRDDINDDKNDNEVMKLKDNLKIRVQDFANIKHNTIINENINISKNIPDIDFVSSKLVEEVEPTWRPHTLTNEQLPSYRDKELNETCSSIETYKKVTDNEVTGESLLKKNEYLADTSMGNVTKVEKCTTIKMPLKKTVISSKTGLNKLFKNNIYDIKINENSTFVCDICNQQYNEKIELIEHIGIHFKNNINTKINRKPFASHVGGEKLIARVQNVTTEKPFKCPFCEYRSDRKNSLLTHIRTHTGEKPFKCHLCEFRSRSKSYLYVHIRTHAVEKPFECHLCEYKSKRNSHLISHIHTHTGEKPFKCHLCEYKAKHKDVLISHIRTHTGEKPFKCHLCEYKAKHKDALISHIRTHTGEKPFKCNFCEYRSGSKSSLKIHIRTHTGEKPYKCHLCEYKAKQKEALIYHIRTHTGEKPFECHLCEYRSGSKGSLKIHIRTHTGEKPYKCHLCEYKAKQKEPLIYHIRNHTGEKPFACNLCEYRSENKYTLKSHIRTHTREKPFKCNLCTYRTGCKVTLKSHIRTHTGEKPF